MQTGRRCAAKKCKTKLPLARFEHHVSNGTSQLNRPPLETSIDALKLSDTATDAVSPSAQVWLSSTLRGACLSVFWAILLACCNLTIPRAVLGLLMNTFHQVNIWLDRRRVKNRRSSADRRTRA